MQTKRTHPSDGLRILIAAGAATAMLTAAGCRDRAGQPTPEAGEGQVDLDLAPDESGAVSGPRAADPGRTRPDAEAPEAGGDADAGEEEVVSRQELESGLVIEDLVVGEGAEAPRGATVTIHYDGRLTDGTPFDSSYDRGEPARFPLGSLIQGWQEGIPGMREGGKRRLLIPYQLAYGERGRPPTIPARADLVFVIELFEVH